MKSLTTSLFSVSIFFCLAPFGSAAITVVTDSAVTGTAYQPNDFTLTSEGAGNRDGLYTYAYGGAGASSDMLVVSISTEATEEAYTVSYGGVGMNLATESGTGTGTSIWYLANPSATGSIAIDYTSKATINGIGLGIASLSNSGNPIYFNNGLSDFGTTSINLTTNYDDSFVFFAGESNNNTNTTDPTIASPLTGIYLNGDLGSVKGAAGYENLVAAGNNTYSWNSSSSEERGISVAAFSAVPEPNAAVLIGLGGILLLVRRRSF